MYRLLKYLLLLNLLFLPTCTFPPTRPSVDRITNYDSIVVDLVYIDGFKPTDEALDFFKEQITSLDIATRITIRPRQVPNTFLFFPLNRSLVVLFEQQNRQLYDLDLKDRQLIMFISCIPGPYIRGGLLTNIAGIQYGATSISVFLNCVNPDHQGSLLLHEFGHILDLVDINQRKEDPVNPDRPSHCNNRRCVMFWQIQGPDAQFDEDCLRDLRRSARKSNR
jgi:hypothetical protein